MEAGGRSVLRPISDLFGDAESENCSPICQRHFRRHDAVIGVYDESGNVIDAHEQGSEFKECEVRYQSAVIRGGSSVW